MEETIDLDDDLLAKAKSYTGLTDISAILHEALTALIQREEKRRLAISDR